jgi:DDE superfamily endonuclease
VCHLDEAGFALTLPTSYSWSPVGERRAVPYEAAEGRQLNVIGAYFTHGPEAGGFQYECVAKLPQRGTKRISLEERAERHGLRPEEVGRIDSTRFLAFVWKIAGRPAVASPDWRRERPLMLVLDNYSVHKSQPVQAEIAALAAAGVFFLYLPSYSPELSAMEPIWQTVKYQELRERSHRVLGSFKQVLEATLDRKAAALRAASAQTAQSLRPAA